jgi:hypothetical protein
VPIFWTALIRLRWIRPFWSSWANISNHRWVNVLHNDQTGYDQKPPSGIDKALALCCQSSFQRFHTMFSFLFLYYLLSPVGRFKYV